MLASDSPGNDVAIIREEPSHFVTATGPRRKVRHTTTKKKGSAAQNSKTTSDAIRTEARDPKFAEAVAGKKGKPRRAKNSGSK